MTMTEGGSGPSTGELIVELRRNIHELSNALTSVLSNGQLAKALAGPESELAQEFEDIVSGGRRATEIARTLKSIAHALDHEWGESPWAP